MLACLSLFAGTVLLSLPTQAADSLLPGLPPTTEWVSGPANRSLGSFASIRIPIGYKFTDAAGARSWLESMTNPVPTGLVGLLAPESGNWWASLVFVETGYVVDEDKGQLNPEEMLKGLADEATKASGSHPKVVWERQPQYSAEEHALEWAVRTEDQFQSNVTHTVCLLGRRGVLTATVVLPLHGFVDLFPLKQQLVRDVAFGASERYADYQVGDKLGSCRLAGLLTVASFPATAASRSDAPLASAAAASAATKAGQPGTFWLWLGIGASVGVAALTGILLVKKTRRGSHSSVRQRVNPERVLSAAAEPARESASSAPSDTTSAPTFEAPKPKPSPAPAGLRPRPVTPAKSVNGKHRGSHRRKAFDYNRYFADLMSAVSSHANQSEGPVPPNGYSFEPGRPTPSQPAEPPAPAPTALATNHSDLIASQKALIEEQKRLIQEQNRLIEEKTKLIVEKNQLLKMQSDLLENKLL